VKFQTITGFRDILPPESALWNRVERTAREVFGTYGYGEIRLPVLELKELFARSIGAETDVVSKEMYSFSDRPRDLPPLETIGDTGPFIERVRKLYESGEIPRDAHNDLTIPHIEKQWAWFQQSGQPPYQQTASEEILDMAIRLNALILGPDVCLRPEATASVVRAYIEHGMHLRPGNTKLCYVGPMFRRERPQKGRYRQFYQIGAELLGPSDHPALDAEVIEMLMAFFGRLQLAGTTLYLNSIGDKNCRPAYVEKLREELRKVKDQLGPDSQRRIETNPLRVLDSKVHEEQAIIANLPRIAEHLCPECKEHYAKLKQELALRGIAYEENWRLVRGLDYYMRTTFEITATGLGSQNAVCGGGRYDGLVELLGGPATTKGIGFAIGTDRLILSLEEAGQAAPKASIAVFLAWFGAPTYPTAVALARKLREQGLAVEMPAVEMKFGKSLSLADRLGARYAVILGEEELAAKQFTVKRLADGEQKKLSEAELFEHLRAC
jgi:histidyl-tRNA synthetase